MLCNWEEKSHKLCIGGCENGCRRKAQAESKANPWADVIKKLAEKARSGRGDI